MNKSEVILTSTSYIVNMTYCRVTACRRAEIFFSIVQATNPPF